MSPVSANPPTVFRALPMLFRVPGTAQALDLQRLFRVFRVFRASCAHVWACAQACARAHTCMRSRGRAHPVTPITPVTK